METKVCSKCKVEKDVFYFKKNKYSKNGLRSECKLCEKEYRDNNKDRFMKSRTTYLNLRKKNDPLHNLVNAISARIRNALAYNKSGVIKENSKLRKILGCSFQDFKQHLESQFEPWMNWQNRGLYNGQKNYGWDIDHIIPKHTAKTEEEVFKLNHFTNLRPRCSYLNRVIDRIK